MSWGRVARGYSWTGRLCGKQAWLLQTFVIAVTEQKKYSTAQPADDPGFYVCSNLMSLGNHSLEMLRTTVCGLSHNGQYLIPIFFHLFNNTENEKI